MTSYAGGTVFAERVGTGTPRVVALHGWRRDRHDLVPAIEGLAAVSVDLPGFGASPEPPAAWGAADYAEVIVDVVTELGAPVVLLGHSFGGRVAVALAAARPELVSGLVLTGVPLLRTSAAARPPLAFRLTRALHKRGLVPDDRMEKLRRSRGSADYQAASGVMRDVLVRVVNESYEAELTSLRCVTQLVWGELDTAAPLDMARSACALVGDATLQVLPGIDHFVPSRAPGALNAALRDVLRAVS